MAKRKPKKTPEEIAALKAARIQQKIDDDLKEKAWEEMMTLRIAEQTQIIKDAHFATGQYAPFHPHVYSPSFGSE